MYDWSKFGNMLVASTLSPTEWIEEWYPGDEFDKEVANTLTEWNVGCKRNNIYNRLMVEVLLNVLLVRVTGLGDLEYQPDIEMVVCSYSPLMRGITDLLVRLLTKDKEVIAETRVEFNPHTGKWMVMDGILPCK